MKKTIYFWAPCLTRVGTVKTTLNSAIALSKFSEKLEVKILNVFGEWTNYKDYLKKRGVIVEDLTFDYYNFLPKHGFLASRFSYIMIILISIFPLINFLKKNRPDFFIIHLITSLPLILWNIFNFKTKLILRVSGYLKLNFLRKKLWLSSLKKIEKILCQTNEQKIFLSNNGIASKNKLTLLPDAILNLKEIIERKKDENQFKLKKNGQNFFLAAGRFTRQKNFIYLIREFKQLVNKYPDEKLLIFGDGELKEKMEKEIIELNLSNNVQICNFTKNIYYYMDKSKAFILSSLWEEVGLVIVEAAMCNSFIISSNCKNGPEEFLLNGKAGLLFENNIKNKLFNKLEEFIVMEKKEILQMKILAKKNCNQFTMFKHSISLKKILL